jgi:hypothetical protein
MSNRSYASYRCFVDVISNAAMDPPALRKADIDREDLSCRERGSYSLGVTADQSPELEAFERSRQKRRGVRQASADLEEALARPASQDPQGWSTGTADSLALLATAFELHVQQSEGAEGLLAEIVEVSPRCAPAVEQIKRDHREIVAELHDLEPAARRSAEVSRIADVREHALGVLQAIARHRQRGADLIYEAYSVDIEAGD